MKSKIAQKIIDETPNSVRREVHEYGFSQIEKQARREQIPSLEQELVEFPIEGHINNYYASKRLPQRIKCIRQHGLIKFEHRKRILAVLCEADSTIYRVGALTMQWMLIKKALREVAWKVRAYE